MPGPILVSVFEPFRTAVVNASQEVGRAVAGDDGIEVLTLPVTRGAAEEMLLHRLRQEPTPSLVLALGEATVVPTAKGEPEGDEDPIFDRQPFVRLEKVAINYDDFRIPDNGGNQPRDAPIRADGPPAYFATLPVGAIARQLERQTPLPVRISLSAGAYLCNHIAYCALDYLAAEPVCPFLFVHVPLWRPDRALFSMGDLVETVRQVIEAARSTATAV